MNNNLIRDVFNYKDFQTSEVGFKDIDGKKGIVTGYFASFNTIDSDGDIIKPGAFTKTINATGPDSPKPRIKHLMNHDISQPLGVILNLKEDQKGLYYESKIGNHSLGMDFVKMAESGLITEHSIGYRTMKYNQLKPWDEWKEGDAARELTDIKLYEGSSLTAWGANSNTPLTGMKGLTDTEINKLLNKSEAIEQFCRNSDASDETIELLLLYSKQLLKSIADLRATQVLPSASKEQIEEKVEDINPTIECPHCKKRTPNDNTKGYIRCHLCNAAFTRGSNLYILNNQTLFNGRK